MTASPILADGLRLLRELIETPSLSGDESAAVQHLVGWMQAHGLAAASDAAGNAVGILEMPGADAPVREVLLLGHIDTVGGFPPVLEQDGRLYGRGAVDAKGPLAAFATAAALVGPQPGWRIAVVGAVEEESASSRGARAVAVSRRPDLVVIGEPSGWQRVTLGYKGRLLAHVEFTRSMSHTAGPAASAPELAFAFWQRIQEALAALNSGYPRIWEQVQATLRHFAAHSDGLIERAELEIGFRLPLHLPPDALQRWLEPLVAPAVVRFHGGEPAYRAEKNTVLVRAFLAGIRSAGGDPGFLLKTGTSDMNVVAPVWQCPILAYGPGDSALDHTPEEHVEIVEWLRAVGVLADALRRLTAPASTIN